MDENILETRIKQRCDTESNWNASNPILLENEVGYIPDGRYKIGISPHKCNQNQSQNEGNSF